MTTGTDLLHAAADLALGARCPGCDRPRLGLCPVCRDALARHRPGPSRPSPTPPGFPPCVAAGPYDPLTRRVLLAVKEQEAWWLRGLLAARLAAAVSVLLASVPAGSGAAGVLLVPLPSDPRTVRARGIDLVHDLARLAARRLAGEHGSVRVARLLRQRRRPRDQAGLTAAQRWANLADALEVRGRAASRRTRSYVVVVDDVVTTGASLSEATRALTAAGITVTGAAVVAATRRRSRVLRADPAVGGAPARH